MPGGCIASHLSWGLCSISQAPKYTSPVCEDTVLQKCYMETGGPVWDDILTLRRVESWWSYSRTGREQGHRAEARVTIHTLSPRGGLTQARCYDGPCIPASATKGPPGGLRGHILSVPVSILKEKAGIDLPTHPYFS